MSLLLKDYRLPQQVEALDKIAAGFKIYQVVKAALELEVFSMLEEKGPSTRDEIVERCGINGMLSRGFLQSLVELGLLEQQEEKYANTLFTESFFLEGKPGYQGDWFNNFSRPDSRWGDLTTTLKKPIPDQPGFSGGPDQAFISAIRQSSLRGELQEAVQEIVNWKGFNQARSLLDLGGGHGLYAIAICQANEQMQATVFDRSDVIDVTKKYIESFGLESRISVKGGDIGTDDWGKGYDIVLVSHLLYKFRKNLDEFFDRLAACLNPGGLLVANHWFCSSGCGAGPDALQELDKSLLSFGHPLCHSDRFRTLFTQKGFRVICQKEITSIFGTSQLHLGEKEVSACGSSCQDKSFCTSC